MNVKELFTNKALMDSIVEDIDEIPEDSKVAYCVWALGYDREDDLNDDEFLLGEFEDPDEAVKFANNFTLEDFNAEYEAHGSTAHLSIEVETVVDDPDNEGTMNIGTVFSKEIELKPELDADGLGDYSNVVCLSTKDFELLADEGVLKVSCSLLRNFNKNDTVIFEFADEPDSSPLEYKIISKVIYADGDYYHCDLLI